MLQLFIFLLCINYTVQQITLKAEGSTFIQPLVEKWGISYTLATYSQTNLNYLGSGSSAAINSILSNSTEDDFVCSDIPLNATGAALAPFPIVQFPLAIGGVTLIVNIPGLKSQLNLSPTLLARIFSLNITLWNDTSLVALNPTLWNVSESIIVYRRSDSSGSTNLLTSFLSSSAPTWWTRGASSSPTIWPLGTIGASQSSGVADSVKVTSYSIGYSGLGDAESRDLLIVAIQNLNGDFVKPSVESLQRTTTSISQLPAAGDTNGTWSNVVILNSNGAQAYPIASFSYLLIYKNLTFLGSKATVVASFLNFILSDTQQNVSKTLDFAPLPTNIKYLNRQTVSQMLSAIESTTTTPIPTPTPTSTQSIPNTEVSNDDGNIYNSSGDGFRFGYIVAGALIGFLVVIVLIASFVACVKWSVMRHSNPITSFQKQTMA